MSQGQKSLWADFLFSRGVWNHEKMISKLKNHIRSTAKKKSPEKLRLKQRSRSKVISVSSSSERGNNKTLCYRIWPFALAALSQFHSRQIFFNFYFFSKLITNSQVQCWSKVATQQNRRCRVQRKSADFVRLAYRRSFSMKMHSARVNAPVARMDSCCTQPSPILYSVVVVQLKQIDSYEPSETTEKR